MNFRGMGPFESSLPLVTHHVNIGFDIRPFQIDFLFLVNPGSKNLPARQEKKTPEKMAELYDTNTKHKLLVIL